MKRPLRFIISVALLALAVFIKCALSQANAAVSHSARPQAESRKAAPPSVILISVDTLRADRLSCYGYRRVTTPHIDAIAKGGTIFSQADSQVPLTLPSHVSLLTSTYPFANGVEDNAAQLGPEAMTLAAVLKAQGYRTGAFVGGFVLDRRFGLDRGFDVYDSPFDLHRQEGKDPGEVKRSGEDVANSAEQWLSESGPSPFFLFLHLYDLHTPYEIPRRKAPLAQSSGYDIELSYVDSVVGSFWDFLQQHDRLANTLVVFVSDHGESLGEHGETTHGYFIYQSTLHVPLIFHWPAQTNGLPALSDEPVSLLDAAPTVLQFLGLATPPQFQGRSFLDSLRGRRPGLGEAIYSESLYAHHHFGTAPLRSLRVNDYQYIDTSRPELYDLAHDPGESRNLYKTKPAVAHTMASRLSELRARYSAGAAPGPTRLSPEAIERLRSLGYLSSTTSGTAPSESGPDPKDRIREYEAYGRALIEASSGRLAEADDTMERLLREDPGLIDVRLGLGLDEQKLGRHDEATKTFQQALQRDPLNALAHFNLAVSEVALKRPDDAVKELQATLALAPYYGRAEELLGTIWLQKHDYGRARDEFNHLLSVNPDDYAAHYNLGALAVMQGNWTEGQQQLERAIELDPSAAEAHNTLGTLYLQTSRLDEAKQEFESAVRLQPDFAWAHYNLGLVLHAQKNDSEALREFRLAGQADPNFAPAREAARKLEGSQP